MYVYNVGITQQYQMLESELNSDVLAMCLKNPPCYIVKSMKTETLKSGFEEALLSSASYHPSAKLVATVAETTSWCWLWDIARNRGEQGTHKLC